MDLSHGPVQSLIDRMRGRDPNAPQTQQTTPGWITGARVGAAGGPIGAVAGGAIGALHDFGVSRGWWGQSEGPIAGQAVADRGLGNATQATQDAIWGNPDSYSMDPNATDMGPPVAGTLPDLRDENADGRISHDERVDAGRGGYGGKFAGTPFNGQVTNFMANGAPVILGSGDPNGRYRNRGRDAGG